MMTFCRRSVHSFLGFSSINITDHNIDQKLSPKCYEGLQGLITATGEIHRPPNVVESSSVKSSSSSSSSSSSPSPSPSPPKKVDSREIGFFIGEEVDGLTSCTESLGFESSDERRVDDHCNNISDEIELLCSKAMSSTSSSSSTLKWRRRRLEREREEKKFPPPLSSLCENGQPSFFLRPVRKDGRLELTEVRIDRPSVFHAHREDGRLRLHIVSDNIIPDEDNNDVEEEEEEEVVLEERVVGGGEWRFEGFRRCHQNPHSNHNDYHQRHQHHNLLGEVS